ncbi:serine protease HTRA4 [Phodopus roborovskii]|uniref:Htra4 protein n=1 Tax=Phodopus roborovskii TaxID=109678 RepID=A0AAU9Z3P9_PHORO|nr:serine protease HTRA4 [Phodopus roborovskii]CAH6787157.1 Htra4 [Phodopus roborovskii]
MSSQPLWAVWAQFLLLLPLLLLLPVPWVEARRSRASMPCPEACDASRCPPLPTCSTGTAPVPDRCGCCRVCAAAEGQECGGARGRPCVSGLRCGAPFSREPAGGAWLGTCGCMEGVEGAAVCGSNGRTYPSLCALRKENRAARLRGSPPAVPVQKGGCGEPGTRSAGWLRRKYNFIAAVVEKVAPSVVHLQLFRRSPLTNHEIPASSGSGFIVSEDGLIVTNAHVLTNHQKIQVELQSGAQYEATVKDIDHKLDLALIKIEPNTDLPVLLLGRSSDLRAGEFVVALGSPFSLQDTVTAGIVSTTQRGGKELGLKDSDIDYIQTDAIINHGNSGGPLVNLDGDVIGINTLKVTAGISFAIPSDRIRQFLADYHERQLKGKAPSQKKYLGLRMLPLTLNLLQEMKRQDPDFPDVSSGVFVYEVIQGTAAASSGLRDHDVIVSINGQPVTTTTDVIEAVKDNDFLSITVLRGSQTLFLTVTPEIIN